MMYCALGQRLDTLQDESCYLVRLSGDEFAAIVRMHNEEQLSCLLEQLQSTLEKPIQTNNGLFNLSASIGVAIAPADGTDRGTLVSNADLAMYRAKRAFGQHLCFYEPHMDEMVRQRQSLASDLRHAITHHQLQVHYQVQTDVISQEIRGYEALLRWHHPERGNIPPTEFIAIAERDTTILALGEWVLRQACEDAAKWVQPYTVAVNLSPM